MRIVCNVANCESYGANVVKVRSVDNVELLVSLPAGESFSRYGLNHLHEILLLLAFLYSTFAQLQGKITDHHEINVQHVLPISTMDVEVYNKAMDLASGQYAQIFNSNTY